MPKATQTTKKVGLNYKNLELYDAFIQEKKLQKEFPKAAGMFLPADEMKGLLKNLKTQLMFIPCALM